MNCIIFASWADQSELEEGKRLAIEALPILGEPSASSEPGEGSLDDPSFGQDDEALGLIGAFEDLNVHALENGSQRILELRPLISAIGVELQKEGIEAGDTVAIRSTPPSRS